MANFHMPSRHGHGLSHDNRYLGHPHLHKILVLLPVLKNLNNHNPHTVEMSGSAYNIPASSLEHTGQ